MATVESKIKELEEETKKLKAVYQTAGSLVQMYMQRSQSWTITATADVPFRVKFTPTYGMGKVNFVDLRPEVTFNGEKVYVQYMNMPQDGSGEVIISMVQPNITRTVNLTVVACGTSPGTFTLL